MTFDITCVITGHNEGRIAVASLRSFWEAIDFCEQGGYSIQPILVLDRPDDRTQRIFEDYSRATENLHIVGFGDQGHARNEAVNFAEGHYCAFLDGDDLWTRDWLVEALRYLADKHDGHIAHPEFNYFFEMQATIFCHIDQESDDFSMDTLRVANYWDALCVCPTSIYKKIPFYTRDIKNGWAYEDWYWNLETVSAGIVHNVVPNSVLFKRRQKSSQTIIASENKSLPRISPLSRYDSDIYRRSE